MVSEEAALLHPLVSACGSYSDRLMGSHSTALYSMQVAKSVRGAHSTTPLVPACRLPW